MTWRQYFERGGASPFAAHSADAEVTDVDQQQFVTTTEKFLPGATPAVLFSIRFRMPKKYL